ncbi:MAG TPA: DmsC/YnfH family molybdoenzyme membrane anchor subunit, partial [Anaerolineales bacterium]
RRVIEVSGGEWQPTGDAWENSVFAYYLSLSCNHCTHPKCAGVCPVDAFSVRPDGIVLLDGSRCMGCGYCAWACPYGAPQYDPSRGIMTKCNLCFDNLDAGIAPTCVSACPLRVLDYASAEGLMPLQGAQKLWQLPGSEHPYPLPDYSRTEPRLAIKLHPAMDNPQDKMISNQEEVRPSQDIGNAHGIAAFNELPLVGFTLLTQMAVGMALSRLVIPASPLALLLAIGILLAVGGLTSFLHLGRKRNAWRAVIHLKKSWLSREILMAGLFMVAWVVTIAWGWLRNEPLTPWLMAVFGIGLLYAMSQVYLLRAVPAWNSWRTPVAFFLSTIVLGVLGVRLIAPFPGSEFIAAIAMGAEMIMLQADRPVAASIPGKLRASLLGLGIIGVLLTASSPLIIGGWLAYLVLLIALIAEGIGRWQFYAQRRPFPR